MHQPRWVKLWAKASNLNPGPSGSEQELNKGLRNLSCHEKGVVAGLPL